MRRQQPFAATYHTLEEIHLQMREMAERHGATFVSSIGESHEQRTIPVLRFGGENTRQTFWIQGGIHAREWVSPATVMCVIPLALAISACGGGGTWPWPLPLPLPPVPLA